MLSNVTKSEVVVLGLLIFISAALASSSGRSNKPYKVVCYLGSWANYRNGDGKFVIEDIDPSLCTHLIYGFAKLVDNRITVYDTYLDLKENWGLGAFDRFNDLRQKNPHLKTLIAIGGWNEGSSKYSRMASSPNSRRTFVNSCIQFLTKYQFDGLDLDWEYPANRGGKSEDKRNFVLLIKELREAFQSHGFLLTAAVSAGEHTIESAYDIPALGKYLDFINLMTYDFHGGWDTVTGHNAPLYARPNDSESSKKLNVDYAVKYWISHGVPPEKLILGMALYGRGFSLQDPKKNGLDAPISGNGMAGEFTSQPGMLGYNEICKILKHDRGWSITTESHVEAPYAVKGKEWIGYDDVKSIILKVKYLRKMNLGGGMVWSIETDDFRGLCHGQRYPLLRTINEVLNDGSVTPPPYNSITPEIVPKSSVPVISSSTRIPPPVISFSTRSPDVSSPAGVTPVDLLPCPYSGYFRHPRDCKMFYFCKPKTSFTKANLYYMFRCGEGTVFNQAVRVCTFPNSVPECSY